MIDTQLQTVFLHEPDGSLTGSSTLLFQPSGTITIENVYMQKDLASGFGDSLHIVIADPSAPYAATSSRVLGELTEQGQNTIIGLNVTDTQPIYAVPVGFQSGEGFWAYVQYYPFDTSQIQPMRNELVQARSQGQYYFQYGLDVVIVVCAIILVVRALTWRNWISEMFITK